MKTIKTTKKDALFWGMFYIADSALSAAYRSLENKLEAMSTTNPSYEEWHSLYKRIKALQTETMNKICKYDEDVIESMGKNGQFFRAIAGVMQVAEKVSTNRFLTDKLYREFNLQDYLDFLKERENPSITSDETLSEYLDCPFNELVAMVIDKDKKIANLESKIRELEYEIDVLEDELYEY